MTKEVSSTAKRLMMLFENDLFKEINFVVSDAMQVGFPITFVSEGFCRLTGGLILFPCG